MADVYRNFSFTRLAAACGAADTTLTVDDVSLLPTGVDLATNDFRMAFDSQLEYQNAFEIVRVTAIDATAGTLTVERGQEGTTAVAHDVGALLKGTLTASMLTSLREAADAVPEPYSPAERYLGAWDAAAAYSVGDTTVYENALWEANAPSTDVVPGTPPVETRLGGPESAMWGPLVDASEKSGEQLTQEIVPDPAVAGVTFNKVRTAVRGGNMRVGFARAKPSSSSTIDWIAYADVPDTGDAYQTFDLNTSFRADDYQSLWLVGHRLAGSTGYVLTAYEAPGVNGVLSDFVYVSGHGADDFSVQWDANINGAGFVMIQAVSVDVAWRKALDFPATTRAAATLTTPSLAAGAQHADVIPMAKGYRLYSIETDVPARVRLYATAAQRDADATRAVGVDPTGDHGLVFEYVTTAEQLSASLSPLVDGANLEAPPSGDIPVLVTNEGAAAAPVNVTLTYLRTE